MYLQYAHKHLKYFAQCAKCIPYIKETFEDRLSKNVNADSKYCFDVSP